MGSRTLLRQLTNAPDRMEPTDTGHSPDLGDGADSDATGPLPPNRTAQATNREHLK